MNDQIFISKVGLDSISSLSSALLSDPDFSDVTLVSEDGQHLVAHRAVLAQASSFLRSILYESLQQRTFLYLGMVKKHVLQELLRFLYMGQCQIQRDSIEQLVQLARQLKIKELEKALVVVEEGGKYPDVIEEEKYSKPSNLSKPKENSKKETNHVQQPQNEIRSQPINTNQLKINDLAFIAIVDDGELCGKSGCQYQYRASRKRDLPRHQNSIHCPSYETNTLVCKLCKTGGKTPTSMANHIKRMMCDKQFPCNGCGDAFRNKQQLKEHMLMKHLA